MSKSERLRAAAALAAAVLCVFVIARILDAADSEIHPTGLGGDIAGLLAPMFGALAAYGGARYGLADRLERSVALAALTVLAAAVFHWMPLVAVLSGAAAVASLAALPFGPAGWRRLRVFASAAGITAAGLIAITVAAVGLIASHPGHHGRTQIVGHGIKVLLGVTAAMAYARSRNALLCDTGAPLPRP